jgi:hypothetical protein
MCDVHCPRFVTTGKIFSVLHFHVVVSALSVVRSSDSDGSFGDSLAMRFVLELADAFRKQKKSVKPRGRVVLWPNSPALVVLALCVRLHVVLALEPLGAFDTVVATEARQIFSILGFFVLFKMTGRVEITTDLVEASAEKLAHTQIHQMSIEGRTYLVMRLHLTLCLLRAPILTASLQYL